MLFPYQPFWKLRFRLEEKEDETTEEAEGEGTETVGKVAEEGEGTVETEEEVAAPVSEPYKFEEYDFDAFYENFTE